MVRVIGLEPTRPKAPEPKSGASTNFATPALEISNSNNNENKIKKKLLSQFFKILDKKHENMISFSLIFRHMVKN